MNECVEITTLNGQNLRINSGTPIRTKTSTEMADMIWSGDSRPMSRIIPSGRNCSCVCSLKFQNVWNIYWQYIKLLLPNIKRTSLQRPINERNKWGQTSLSRSCQSREWPFSRPSAYVVQLSNWTVLYYFPNSYGILTEGRRDLSIARTFIIPKINEITFKQKLY